MIKISAYVLFFCLIFIEQTVIADQCKQVNINYARKCGAVDNINNLNRLLTPGDCAEIFVNAKSRWNATGISFEQDAIYKIEVVTNNNKQPTWFDASIETNAEGWESPQNSLFSFFEFARRREQENWFHLIGVTVGKSEHTFSIGTGIIHKAVHDGEFCSFANDSSFTYWNNRGSLPVRITRLAKERQVSRSAIIDAGSSGSRYYLYETSQNAINIFPDIDVIPSDCKKIEPGLHKSKDVADYLKPLIHCAKIADPDATIHLLATAGMRGLSNKKRKQAILNEVRLSLENAALPIGDIRIITGEEEAEYAWLTVNSIMDSFDKENTWGVIELGGASAQIAFKSAIQHAIDNDHHIVTHSAAGCGKAEIYKQIEDKSCFPAGLGDGEGNFEKCSEYVRKTLQSASVDGKKCSLAKFSIPKPVGKFAAVSSYYFAASTLLDNREIVIESTPGDMIRAGRKYCSLSWDEIKSRYQVDDSADYYKYYCLDSAYITTVLLNGYGFDENYKISFIKKYPSASSMEDETVYYDTSWTLGAALFKNIK